MLQQISESELVLMKIIWKNEGTALYSQIIEQLEQDNALWKKNTVLTLLSRLIEKNYLKIRKIGRRNEYIALVKEEEYQTTQTHSFLTKVFGGNVKNLVSTLLQQDILSAEELREVEEYWAEISQSSGREPK
ncbi:MAG: BlaI/MecI/CopY family transcriptional regulator [Lachnospiraceae bacterium]|nr:BlaI/MecI/CopY family transcriptional regulator [Lachnospiraceae bacterium]